MADCNGLPDDANRPVPSEALIESTTETFRRVMDTCANQPHAFQSFYEMEQQVDEWTPEEIAADPVKKILTHAENSNLAGVMDCLAENPALLNCSDDSKYTCLHRAAYNGDLPLIKFLVDEKGADMNVCTTEAWLPLHSAAFWDHTECVAYFLSKDCDVNARTANDNTPLHLACQNAGTPNTIAFLLSHPLIDFRAKNCIGETPRIVCERANAFSRIFDSISSNYSNAESLFPSKNA